MISDISEHSSTPRHVAEGLRDLRDLLGADGLREDPETLARFGVDRSPGHLPAPRAVALPRDTDQVLAIVRIAREHRLPLVPSGGRTGLCGGAVAAQHEVVVSMQRMDRVLGFDPVDRAVTVQAGVITAELQAFAARQGLFYPVDFASAGSSQIGGNIATNAGGIRVIRHGMSRQQVLGLVVVDGRGERLDLNRGLLKNNTGPDLQQLFIGSEGVLGIITEATLRLQPAPQAAAVLLFAIPDLQALLALLERFSNTFRINAFEFFSDKALEYVTSRFDRAAPLRRAPFYALVEVERGDSATEERLLAAFEASAAAGTVLDGVVAHNETQARALWQLRESISETLAPFTPWKNDISVRISRLPAFVAAADELLSRDYPALESVWYGHIGDGNLHINILRPSQMDLAAFKSHCEPLARGFGALLQEFGGSVSAEHGIGLLKRDQLRFSRSEAEISALRGLKSLFDPLGILNPGKLLPPD